MGNQRKIKGHCYGQRKKNKRVLLWATKKNYEELNSLPCYLQPTLLLYLQQHHLRWAYYSQERLWQRRWAAAFVQSLWT